MRTGGDTRLTTKPFIPSTSKSLPSVLAKCDQCNNCSTQWSFKFVKDALASHVQMVVEKLGECGGERNVKRLKKDNAKKYSTLTAAKAALKLEEDGVAAEEWPEDHQIKHCRLVPKTESKEIPAQCLATLRDFLAAPPAEITVVVEKVECTSERARIPFYSVAGREKALEIKLPCMLMDFTFKTNREGLLLGAVGPVGLVMDKAGPSMRFLPVFFMIADAEDTDAHKMLLNLYVHWADEAGIEISDGFFDCTCLTSALQEYGDRMYLHRCLQHTKTNVKTEAKKKDEVTGKARLANTELARVIVDWVEFSAALPNDLEFHVFWASILRRMESSRSSSTTNFEEAAMAKYLKDHILDMSGPCIRASWQCGLGAVPMGFTTYAVNAIERAHRSLKGFLDGGWELRSISELMGQVGRAVQNRVKKGCYNGLVARVDKASPLLTARLGVRSPGTEASESVNGTKPQGQSKRLDLNKLLAHYRVEGPKHTFLTRSCHLLLPTGERARRVYVMPKYELTWSVYRAVDMEAALDLAVADDELQVRAACANKRTGTYDIFRHIYLRQNFVSIYVTGGDKAVDGHKHFVEGGGFSEHSLFISGLVDKEAKDGLDPIAQGPKNSRPAAKRHPFKPKLSEALRSMLGAPEPVAGEKPDASYGPALAGPMPIKDEVAARDGLAGAAGARQQCIAKTKEGGRCCKEPKVGQYCKQHAQACQSKRVLALVLNNLQPGIKHAQARLAIELREQEGLDSAMAMSAEEAQRKERWDQSRQRMVMKRLADRQLQRVPTAPYGNCQFIAVCQAAGLDVGHESLRQQVVNYLEHCSERFGSFADGFPNFDRYLEYMRRDGSWGDHLTLTAVADLLLRPVHVITDSTHSAAAEVIIKPSAAVSPEAWGEPIVLAHYHERHYEATARL